MRQLSARLQALWQSLGGFSALRVTWLLALVFCAWAVVDVLFLHVSSGLTDHTYDTMVNARFHTRAVDPRIVIVDIDEASLARMGKEFGQWPWPRDTHASLLNYIEQQRPAAVVWDVVFSDADLQNPGGDAAFNAVAAQSPHSHFSVVRLPAQNDAQSQITRQQLPGLWASSQSGQSAHSKGTSTLAVIPPVLPALAASRLGYNNGYVDKDGVLRRYRYAERLADGSVIQSTAASVMAALQPELHRALVSTAQASATQRNELVDWRAKTGAYPRISFADVFALAEGAAPTQAVGNVGNAGYFKDKIVIVGSTAPSLHDIHPTPLSPHQHGVDSLATVIDNGLNGHRLHELPLWFQTALACALFIGIALWVGTHGLSSLAPVTLALPAVLLLISYVSLNVSSVFVDLHLAAGLSLVLLAVLKGWNTLRRDYWHQLPAHEDGATLHAWLILGDSPWADARMDRLLSAVQHAAPDCRVLAGEGTDAWPTRINWPGLVCVAAIIGTEQTLTHALPALQRRMAAWVTASERIEIQTGQLWPSLFEGWSNLHKSGTNRG